MYITVLLLNYLNYLVMSQWCFKQYFKSDVKITNNIKE